jgi:AraC-like DNA-binding protein
MRLVTESNTLLDPVIPDRRYELADRSYRMVRYTWFRLVGRVQEMAYPHYLGHGVAINARYNIRDVWQAPMPDHVLIKIGLTPGGAIASSPSQPLRSVKSGEAILRFVQDPDIWETFHPNHQGTWEFLGLIMSGSAAASCARGLIDQFGRVYPLGTDSPLVKQLLQIASEPNHVTGLSAAQGFRLCTSVFAALLDAAEASVGRSTAAAHLAEKVEFLMRQDLRRDWSVEDLAERHNVSREHLTRLFTRHFGIPPHRFLIELRIQEACRRLRTTDEPVKSIVHALGFRSHANFVRTFRRFNNMSPTEYRQRDTGDTLSV